MKKFKFPLETVLSYKQQILDSLQIEHAEVLSKLGRQERFLEELWREYREYGAEYQLRCSEGMDITDARTYQEGLRARERDIERATERLNALKKQEAAKREEVIEAKKDTSSLEKLREKQWGAYQATVTKNEEQLVEEFVMAIRSTGQAAAP